MEMSVGITLEINEASSLIELEGTIDIGEAAQLKTVLRDALQANKPISLSFDRVRYLDVTAVQLLCAAERKAKASALKFSSLGAMPEPVAVALKETGFDLFPVSD